MKGKHSKPSIQQPGKQPQQQAPITPEQDGRAKRVWKKVSEFFSIELGSYDPATALAAIVMMFMLMTLDVIMLLGWIDGLRQTGLNVARLFLLNIIAFLIIFLPPIVRFLESKISADWVENFLELPKKSDEKKPVSFPQISAFLSEQALASFLITAVLALTPRFIELFNEVIVYLLSSLFFVAATIFAFLSAARFLLVSGSARTSRYMLTVATVVVVTGAFWWVGIALADQDECTQLVQNSLNLITVHMYV